MTLRLSDFFSGTFRNQLLRAFGSGISVRVLAVIASLLSSIALARTLGPETYGTYAFVLALVALLALPVQMGLPTLITRETAKAATLQDWGLLRGIWSWSTRLILIGSALIVAVVIVGLMAFPNIMSPERHEAVFWGVWLVPLLALAAAREAALRGLKAIFLSGLPDQIVRPLILATLVVAAGALANDALTARATMQLFLVAATFAFLLGVVLLLQKRPQQVSKSKPAVIKQAEWLKAVIPFSLIVGLQMIRENTDILMLGYWYGDSDVGLYRVALSISTLVIFGLMALYLVAQPYIVSTFTVGDRRQLQNIVRLIATVSVLSSLAVTSVIWLEGKFIIQLLYGNAFEEAHTPLAILAVGSVFHACFGMAGGVLSMTGNERHVLWASIISVALNVFGNALLIPTYGAVGAASATAFSLTVGEVLKYFTARRHLGIDGSIFAWLNAGQLGDIRK